MEKQSENKSPVMTDVLQSDHHTHMTDEEIAKARAHHNKRHNGEESHEGCLDFSGTLRSDLSLGFHNCGSLSLVVVFISLLASELRVLESRPSVTDRNLERIASLLAVPTILPRSFPSTKYSSVGMD